MAGDPSVEAQLMGNGDLRLLSIRRAGVWYFSDIDTIAWWTWHTVGRADVIRLVPAGGDVLSAVRDVVAPALASGSADERVAGLHRLCAEWLTAHGVSAGYDSYDEHEA